MSNLVSIGAPVANTPGRYCGSSPLHPDAIRQSVLNEITEKRLKVASAKKSIFTQQIHMGVDGLVVISTKNKGTVLFLNRNDIAKFALGESKHGHSVMIVIARGSGSSWAAHVFDMDSPNSEQMVEAGELVLIRTWPVVAPPMALAPGQRGGQTHIYSSEDNHEVEMAYRDEKRVVHITIKASYGGFGFMFSTNKNELLDGINHYVSTVDAGGAADKAGLRRGDRILKVNSVDVCNFGHDSVIKRIRQHQQTSPLTLTVSGPNKLIRVSMRQKHRHMKDKMLPAQVEALQLSQQRNAELISGRNPMDDSRFLGGVPESELGSIAFGTLESAMFVFATQFCVPAGMSLRLIQTFERLNCQIDHNMVLHCVKYLELNSDTFAVWCIVTNSCRAMAGDFFVEQAL
eukprot:m.801599 g.801599  ORF g.801599 m.801599 type:complete len:402 (-) comp23360_c1_seq8:305-1510(-)